MCKNNVENGDVPRISCLIYYNRAEKTSPTFNDSDQDGLTHGLSGSCTTGSILLRNSISTQSMILMIRWGGLASFLTVAMFAALIVYKYNTPVPF